MPVCTNTSTGFRPRASWYSSWVGDRPDLCGVPYRAPRSSITTSASRTPARHTCCGLLGDAPKSSAAITVYPRLSAASLAAARYSSMPAITELMNTFTLASAVSGTSLTASPPRGEPPRLRPAAVQMPLA